MLNKSNFWPPRGSDHFPSVKIATFRGQAKVRFIQQRPWVIKADPAWQTNIRRIVIKKA
ncbi:hypothetical protein [Serratia symbiotica]|uniref:hypothetical protein n=1 Tax=Serratia symbiotica TaxID=138074 RepID=UPI0030D29B4A|nr:hypothetical protein [Serratia symbiotica]